MRRVYLAVLVTASCLSSNIWGDEDQDRFDAEKAVLRLDVHDALQVKLFAAEPQLKSPSNIDIDHRGRVWVCEIVNYRGHKGKRPDGDRILVLEDTDHDGRADQQTVFYQGSDIDSPHGVCVLGTADDKGTQVIVSAKGQVQIFTDNDGDLKADSQRVMFTGISGQQHDHGIHAFVFGPDGKLYFNFGNEGKQIKTPEGKVVVDLAGNEVNDKRRPYQQGMVFRCNLDASEFETLAWNFRNNWELAVDSFGTIWQSDNDDDGNKAVRINYVMEFGNYGFRDEMTGAGWQQQRTGMHDEVPLRHWHLRDPGVVPNLIQTGAGSPTGILVYEGDLLPSLFHGQLIHCDAGPNIVRAYLTKPDGAGYSAEIENILHGAREQWFRPSDVCTAPDGSLIVADWFDPGVGGHGMGDLERGRVFRITPRGHSGYAVPAYDFSTAAGAVAALHSPNSATRYVAFQTLHGMGHDAEEALQEMLASPNPVFRARALWLLGRINGHGQAYVDKALADKDARVRILGLRLARQLGLDMDSIVAKLVHDDRPEIRRECAIALRGRQSDQAAELWAELAAQHDGKDRWYLEALGIGADGRWDVCLEQWRAKVGDQWNLPAGRDIVWRSRASTTPEMLAQLITHKDTREEEKARYFRALDFHSGPAKEKALQSLLGL